MVVIERFFWVVKSCSVSKILQLFRYTSCKIGRFTRSPNTRCQLETHIFFAGSTTTAIESWLMVCILFIFMAMLEYGIVVVLNRMRNANHQEVKVHSKSNKSTIMVDNKFEKNLDKISLGLSVFFFALYNIVYWKCYW